MKKVVLILAASAFVLGMSSCKKDWTCTCTITTTTFGVSNTTTASTTINDTKSNAEDACDSNETSSNLLGISTSSTCEIE